MSRGYPTSLATSRASLYSAIAPSEPGTVGTPAGRGDLLRLDFVAHPAEDVGGRADEADPFCFAHGGEVGVFGEGSGGMTSALEPMPRQSPRERCGTSSWPARADGDGLIGQLHRQRICVGLGVGEHTTDAQLFACPDDA